MILGLAILAFWPIRSASWVYEDVNWQAFLRDPPDLRWNQLTALSFQLQGDWWGRTPAPFHAVNLLLHLLNGCLVGLLAGPFAMGLMLLHPLQTEAVAYVAARYDVLATLFVLLACWCVRRHWTPVHCAAAMVCCVLAFLAKSSAIVSAPLVLLWILWRGWRPRGWWVYGVACGTVLIAAKTLLVTWIDRYSWSAAGSWWDSFTRTSASLFDLSWRLMWPFGLSIEHAPQPWAWAGFALCGVVLLALWRWPSRTSFAVLWTVVALSPRFVFTLPELIHERHLYLPLAGVALAMGVRWR